MENNDELVRAYWEHYRHFVSPSREDRVTADAFAWAYDRLDELAREAPADVVPLLVDLAHAAADDRALAYLGAGPIEDLITFRIAVRCAWFDESVDPVTRDRLRRFGDPL